MKGRDLFQLSIGVIRSHPLRSILSMLGIAIGIAAVVLLTSIGEGARRYILSQFTQFGTNILSVHPGKVKTLGVPGVLGGTTRKLTIDDAEALHRLPTVQLIIPSAVGQANVEARGLNRSVVIIGTTSDGPDLWRFGVRFGTFLPAGDPRRGSSLVVLGPKLKQELFEHHNALGQYVHIGGTRFQVIGVMESKGNMLGFDLDDTAFIPVASAMKLFNLEELTEINVQFHEGAQSEQVGAAVTQLLKDRHDGEEDFTVTTQDAMLSVFDNIMNIITMAVGVIGGISLLVGAIGILTMMWIAVNERTAEIGLMRSLGASAAQVRQLFFAESILLALVGGIWGISMGLGIAAIIRFAVPGLPVFTPKEYLFFALAVSTVTGLLAGILPANRAATLDPIEALRAE